MLIFDLSHQQGRIRARGANRMDFLHRMSTGNLLGIQPGEGRATVFTTPIGRMVDHAAVLAFEDSLLMLCGPAPDKLVRWLRKYIFFNDDVQLTDETGQSTLLGIFGERATEFAEGMHAGAGQLPRYAHASIGDGTLIVAPPLQGSGYYLLGTNLQSPISNLSEYEDLRIRSGYPAAPNEINENYIPLEANLASAVSFSKGCYIGQEIIARMESRGQLAKRLMRIESEGVMHAGDLLTADGAQAGSLTSVTSDGHAALGYVRSAHAIESQTLVVGADGVPARVAGTGGM